MLTEEISLGDYISIEGNLVTKSIEAMNTVYISFCDESSVVRDHDEKVNNKEDPEDLPNGRKCLEMIVKIHYYFQFYKAECLLRESMVNRDIQRLICNKKVSKTILMLQTYK